MAYLTGSIVNGKWVPATKIANTGNFLTGNIVNGKWEPSNQTSITANTFLTGSIIDGKWVEGQANPTTKSGVSDYIKNSLNQIKQTISHPFQAVKNTVSAAINSIVGTFKAAGSATKEAFTGENETIAKKVADMLYAVGADVSIVFAPISAAFAAAEQLPGLKQAADLISLPFTVTGKIGMFAAESFIKALPINQESKDLIAPAFGQVGSLAGQILLGGKIMSLISGGKKIDKLTLDEAIKDTNIKTEIAKQEAIKAQPQAKIAPVETISGEKGTIPQINPVATGMKVSKAANDINKAIVEQGFKELSPEELAQYPTITKRGTIDKITNLLNMDYEKAKRMSLGKESTGDIPAQPLFNAVKNKALLDGDIELIRELAKSPVATERALLAQQLGAAGYNNEPIIDPVKAISEISKAREKGIKPENIIKEAKVAKSTVWSEFIKKLEC